MSMIYLNASDAVNKKDKKEAIAVSRKAACMSALVESMIEDDEEGDQVIDLPNVRRQTLMKVMEFCTKHAEDPMKKIPRPVNSNDMVELVSEWDANFINVDNDVLFDMCLAANYMNISPLLELTCCKLAVKLRMSSEDEIKKEFNIPDLSPEEEAKLREENKWIFETRPDPTPASE